MSASIKILFMCLMCMLSASTNILLIKPHVYGERKHQYLFLNTLMSASTNFLFICLMCAKSMD
jgi:hypothetical protein